MPLIYHQADTVLAWLGESADGSDDVLSLADHGDDSVFWADECVRGKVRQMTVEINRFFQRAYWTRTWIIQEIKKRKNTSSSAAAATLTDIGFGGSFVSVKTWI